MIPDEESLEVDHITVTTSEREIESLITLLEDPDPEIRRRVENRFQELGDRAVPLLDQQRANTRCEKEKAVIESVLTALTFEGLYSDYLDLLDNGIEDMKKLEEVILLLARIGNPTLRTGEYKRKLDRFAVEVAGQIYSEPSEKRRLKLFLQYVFRELRFRGDYERYHHPDNGLLDRVIDRRQGLPLMLSVIVLFLSERLGLPFHGLNMPIHFMLYHKGSNEQLLIDPFDGGRIVTYDQCHHFLKQNGISPRPEHFTVSEPGQIVLRAIRNLIHSYSMLDDENKVNQLRLLLKCTEERLATNI